MFAYISAMIDGDPPTNVVPVSIAAYCLGWEGSATAEDCEVNAGGEVSAFFVFHKYNENLTSQLKDPVANEVLWYGLVVDFPRI